MRNLSKDLFAQLRDRVYEAQVGKVHRLEGKSVLRDGVVFRVVSVDWRRGKIEVSDAKTPPNQTVVFAVRSFLSKAVEVMQPEKGRRSK